MLILQERSPHYFCHEEKLITCHKWDHGDKHRSSFIIKAIPLIARGQLVWVEAKEDMTTSWHPVQFVIRYAQVAYCGYTLIDSSDPKIRAALRMENYFQIRSLDLCLTKLMGSKSLTSIRADPKYTGVQSFAGSRCVFVVQTLEAARHRAATEARWKKREGFLWRTWEVDVFYPRVYACYWLKPFCFSSEVCATHINSESTAVLEWPILIGVRNVSFLLKSITGNVSVQRSADVHGY